MNFLAVNFALNELKNFTGKSYSLIKPLRTTNKTAVNGYYETSYIMFFVPQGKKVVYF